MKKLLLILLFIQLIGVGQDVFRYPQAYICSNCVSPSWDIENHPSFKTVNFTVTKRDEFLEVKSEELDILFLMRIVNQEGENFKVDSDYGNGFVMLSDMACWISLGKEESNRWNICISLYNRFN